MRKPIDDLVVYGNKNVKDVKKTSVVSPSAVNKIKITPTNSNTRILSGAQSFSYGQSSVSWQGKPGMAGGTTGGSMNLGLNSDRLRHQMVERLKQKGITDTRVLAAMLVVPRHIFVDQGLASRAYEDAALPIGFSQTISQPWIISRMLSIVCENRNPQKVLEIGAGCGYQAAVMAHLFPVVYSIERIKGLYDMAREHLRDLRLVSRVRLIFGDGMLGLPAYAPFDAIVIAAAGMEIPSVLLHQLSVGGRLIAPEGTSNQRLVLIERTGEASWDRSELEAVRFVPLRSGIQS
ncbi:protein-L-isoaspartate(D-aspartate) O-methyltransferase [Advenella sp. WQ 585]|uniref:Protein-L-isoaspartate O-methyltransferase n=2 Tax=Advenella mandrilli TaxID=2800330 RepID=A0ABS1EH73_9BURK|nr:protein-L-isoaspartate(D-aspartate) O-methyltransferase [Advenella mandrilli]